MLSNSWSRPYLVNINLANINNNALPILCREQNPFNYPDYLQMIQS